MAPYKIHADDLKPAASGLRPHESACQSRFRTRLAHLDKADPLIAIVENLVSEARTDMKPYTQSRFGKQVLSAVRNAARMRRNGDPRWVDKAPNQAEIIAMRIISPDGHNHQDIIDLYRGTSFEWMLTYYPPDKSTPARKPGIIPLPPRWQKRKQTPAAQPECSQSTQELLQQILHNQADMASDIATIKSDMASHLAKIKSGLAGDMTKIKTDMTKLRAKIPVLENTTNTLTFQCEQIQEHIQEGKNNYIVLSDDEETTRKPKRR